MFSKETIANYDQPDHYWLVMGDNVYEFKDWTHPGGWFAHKNYAGGKQDAQERFNYAHAYSYGAK